jgi:hypothetical protein
MNLSLLLPLLLTTAFALVGSYVVHRMTVSRDRANKRRELRVQYLIDAYRKLEGVANRSSPVDTSDPRAAILESSVADIQLFGSASQVGKAKEFAKQFASKQPAKLDELLADLRQDLRKELDLEPVAKDVLHLRVS